MQLRDLPGLSLHPDILGRISGNPGESFDGILFRDQFDASALPYESPLALARVQDVFKCLSTSSTRNLAG